ncbi:MAG: hypothetical protein ACRBN8_29975 [Nannocystales bacterium]
MPPLLRLSLAGGLSLMLLAACDPKDSSLGDLPQSETELDSEDMPASDPTDSDDTGSEASVVGQPCELGQAPLSAMLEEVPSEACGGGYCLYAENDVAPFGPCSTDEDCAESPESGKNPESTPDFYCDAATDQCKLDPAFVADRSMCTQQCDTVTDCVGADGTTCEGGFSCAPVSSLGALCCQNVCVCNDDLDFTSSEELRAACDENAVAGCCDQDPPGLGCG